MARYRRATQRGKSFVKKIEGLFYIGYYIYKSRYSGSGSYGGRKRLGFIIQKGPFSSKYDSPGRRGHQGAAWVLGKMKKGDRK
jgi:hypothetical protein